MAELLQFPVARSSLLSADPLLNAVRLGLNLWAQSIDQRQEFCRRIAETLSAAFMPVLDRREDMVQANLEFARFLADRPFALEREFLTFCQAAAADLEKGQHATNRRPEGEVSRSAADPGARRRRVADSTSDARGTARPNHPPTAAASAPEPKPLQIQTPIGLNHPVIVPIRLRNHKNSASQIGLSATPYMDDLGRVSTAPPMRFQPAELEFPGPGSYEAAGIIDTRSGFEANRLYKADILVRGEPAMRIPFYIQTLPPPMRYVADFTAELADPGGEAER